MYCCLEVKFLKSSIYFNFDPSPLQSLLDYLKTITRSNHQTHVLELGFGLLLLNWIVLFVNHLALVRINTPVTSLKITEIFWNQLPHLLILLLLLAEKLVFSLHLDHYLLSFQKLTLARPDCCWFYSSRRRWIVIELRRLRRHHSDSHHIQSCNVESIYPSIFLLDSLFEVAVLIWMFGQRNKSDHNLFSHLDSRLYSF